MPGFQKKCESVCGFCKIGMQRLKIRPANHEAGPSRGEAAWRASQRELLDIELEMSFEQRDSGSAAQFPSVATGQSHTHTNTRWPFLIMQLTQLEFEPALSLPLAQTTTGPTGVAQAQQAANWPISQTLWPTLWVIKITRRRELSWPPPDVRAADWRPANSEPCQRCRRHSRRFSQQAKSNSRSDSWPSAQENSKHTLLDFGSLYW